MIMYSVDITVERPPAGVFPYLADVTRHPSWMGGSAATAISDGPMRVGYRYGYTTAEGDFEMEVTDYQPGTQFSARTVSGPFDWTGTFHIDPPAKVGAGS